MGSKKAPAPPPAPAKTEAQKKAEWERGTWNASGNAYKNQSGTIFERKSGQGAMGDSRARGAGRSASDYGGGNGGGGGGSGSNLPPKLPIAKKKEKPGTDAESQAKRLGYGYS